MIKSVALNGNLLLVARAINETLDLNQLQSNLCVALPYDLPDQHIN